MKFYRTKTVQRGKRLSEARLRMRLKELATNKKSVYYNDFHAGHVKVQKESSHYNIVVMEEIPAPPKFQSECSCGRTYYSFMREDYLCEECRAEIDG